MSEQEDDIDITGHMDDIKKWCKDPERLKEYDISIRKATEQNRKDDSFLSTSDFVPEDLWNRIAEAIGYDSAAAVEWAVKKLSILYKRSQSGEMIFVPGINVYLEKTNFEEVISKTFSKALFKEILKLTALAETANNVMFPTMGI